MHHRPALHSASSALALACSMQVEIDYLCKIHTYIPGLDNLFIQRIQVRVLAESEVKQTTIYGYNFQVHTTERSINGYLTSNMICE